MICDRTMKVLNICQQIVPPLPPISPTPLLLLPPPYTPPLLPSLHPYPILSIFPLYTPTLLFLSSLSTLLPYSSSVSPLLPPLLPPSSHAQIDAHQDDANAVAFADESSQIIFSGGDDGICKVWDRRTLSETHCSPVGILAGHKDGITFIDAKVCLPPHTHTHTLTQCSVLCCAATHTHTCTHSHMHSLMHTCTHSHMHSLTQVQFNHEHSHTTNRGTVPPSHLL